MYRNLIVYFTTLTKRRKDFHFFAYNRLKRIKIITCITQVNDINTSVLSTISPHNWRGRIMLHEQKSGESRLSPMVGPLQSVVNGLKVTHGHGLPLG